MDVGSIELMPRNSKKVFSGKTFFWATLILFSFAVVVQGIFLSLDDLVGPRTWGSIPDLIMALGGVDAANYLRIGLDLSDGVLTSENLWILNLWPPGMPALYTLMILLPGAIVPKMALFNALVWAVAGGMTIGLIKPSASKIAIWGFVLFWTCLSNPFSWVLGNGILFSDGIGASLLIIVLNLVFIANRLLDDFSKKTKKTLFFLSFFAGAILGLALAFRWAFVIVVTLVSIFALLGSLVLQINLLINRANNSALMRKQNVFLVLVSLSLGIFIAILPWTLVAQFKLHPGNPTWSMGDYQWAQRWLTDKQLNAAGAGFLVEGNANWSCEIAPLECQQLNELAFSNNSNAYDELRSAAILSAANNPVGFFQNRLDALGRGWFSSPGSKVGSFDSIGYGSINLLLAALFIIFTVIMWNRYRLYNSIVCCVILGLLAALFVAHIENRYLIPLNSVIGVVTFTLLANMNAKTRKAVGNQV